MECAPQSILCTPFAHPNAPLFLAAAEALRLRDTEIAGRLVCGHPAGGFLPTMGTWDIKESVMPTQGVAFDDLPHESWNRFLAMDVARKATGSPKGRASAKAVLLKTLEELDLGYCDGPFTRYEMDLVHGARNWVGTRRTAIEQPGDASGEEWFASRLRPEALDAQEEVTFRGLARALGRGRLAFEKEELSGWGVALLTTDSWCRVGESVFRPVMPMRNVDNDSEYLKNESCVSWDKQRAQSPDFPARAVRRCHLRQARLDREAGSNDPTVLPQFGHGTDDVQAAHRKAMSATPSYQVAAVYVSAEDIPPGIMIPRTDQTLFFKYFGFLFGNQPASSAFAAVVEGVLSPCRRIGGFIADHCADDVDIVDQLSNGERGQLALGRIFACHGFPFKPKKHVPLALSNKFMGIETDFSLQLTEGVVIVGPTQSRIDKVARLCGRSRESCSPKVARRIAGLIQYSGQWSGGRSLLPVLQPIRARGEDREGSRQWPSVTRALGYLEKAVPLLKPRRVELTLSSEKPLLVWSDAMSEGQVGRGGFVIIIPPDESGRRRGIVAEGVQPPEVVAKFRPELKTYIGQLELLWAASPIASYPHLFANRRVIHFIDNSGAVGALIKGYGSRAFGYVPLARVRRRTPLSDE